MEIYSLPEEQASRRKYRRKFAGGWRILRKCSPASRNITWLPKVAVRSAHDSSIMHVYRYISYALTAIYLYTNVFTIHA